MVHGEFGATGVGRRFFPSSLRLDISSSKTGGKESMSGEEKGKCAWGKRSVYMDL